MIAEQHKVPTPPAIAITLANAVFGSRKLSRNQAFTIASQEECDLLATGSPVCRKSDRNGEIQVEACLPMVAHVVSC